MVVCFLCQNSAHVIDYYKPTTLDFFVILTPVQAIFSLSRISMAKQRKMMGPRRPVLLDAVLSLWLQKLQLFFGFSRPIFFLFLFLAKFELIVVMYDTETDFVHYVFTHNNRLKFLKLYA